MVITYLGGYCFKLSSGDTVIAVNPPSGKSAHKVSKFGADIVLIATEHPDWNGKETASLGGKEPFVVRSPGAYEVGDAVIHGYASEGGMGKEASPYGNTIYTLDIDGISVLLLGALSGGKLSQEARADIDSVDIVFVPVGGAALDAKKAHDLVVSLEPKLIIPYAVGDGGDLKEFIETEGAKGLKPIEKLTIRAKDIAALSGEIAVLQ